MRYSFVYLFIFLIIIMFLMRLFLPIFLYLLPVLVVFLLVRNFIIKRRHKESQQETYENYQSADNYNQSSYSDVIDVDYKVVDEEDVD